MASTPAPEPARQPSPWGRLALTLVAPLVVFGGRRLPLPGVSLDRAHLSPDAAEILTGKLSPVALGLVPYVVAALLVELVAAVVPRFRPLRVAGPAGRAKLSRATALVFLAVAAFQAKDLARAIWEFDESVSQPKLALTLVAGSAVLALVAGFVGRRGLTHGVLAVLASDALARTVDEAFVPRQTLGLPPVPVLGGCVAAVALVTAFALRKRGPSLVAVPSTGLWPVRLAAGALGGTAALAVKNGGPLAGLLQKTTGHAAFRVAITVALVIVLAQLVSDPTFVAPLWSRATERSLADAEADAKKAASDALPATLTFCLALVLVGEAAGALAAVALDVTGLALATALVLDAAGEIRARRRLGALVAVWTEVRPYAVAAAGAALDAAEIPFFVRDARQRALLHVLGPFAPSEIFVAPSDAEDAAAVIADALDAPTPEDDATARVADAKASATAGVGAAVAIVASLLLGLAKPSLPNPVMLGATVDVTGHRSTLALVAVDDEADPFGPAGNEDARGIRWRFENAPLGERSAARRYAVVVPLRDGEDLGEALREAQPFFAKASLPPGDRLAFGPLQEENEDGKSELVGLRTWVIKDEPPAATEADIESANAVVPEELDAPLFLALRLKPAAAERFRALTARWTKRRIAILIDGRVESAPRVLGEIKGGNVQITMGKGDRDEQIQELKRLEAALRPPNP